MGLPMSLTSRLALFFLFSVASSSAWAATEAVDPSVFHLNVDCYSAADKSVCTPLVNAALQAKPADWMLAGNTANGDEVFVDKNSVTGSGTVRAFWLKMPAGKLSEAPTAAFALMHEKVLCDTQEAITTAVRVQDVTGQDIEDDEHVAEKRFAINSASPIGKVAKWLCSKPISVDGAPAPLTISGYRDLCRADINHEARNRCLNYTKGLIDGIIGAQTGTAVASSGGVATTYTLCSKRSPAANTQACDYYRWGVTDSITAFRAGHVMIFAGGDVEMGEFKQICVPRTLTAEQLINDINAELKVEPIIDSPGIFAAGAALATLKAKYHCAG